MNASISSVPSGPADLATTDEPSAKSARVTVAMHPPERGRRRTGHRPTTPASESASEECIALTASGFRAGRIFGNAGGGDGTQVLRTIIAHVQTQGCHRNRAQLIADDVRNGESRHRGRRDRKVPVETSVHEDAKVVIRGLTVRGKEDEHER